VVAKKKRLVRPKAKPKPKVSVMDLLSKVGAKPKAKAKKKDAKPVVTLVDDPENPQYLAFSLLQLQQAKAAEKAAAGRKVQCEGDLFGLIEQKRLDINARNKCNHTSIRVTAKGLTPPAFNKDGTVKTTEDGTVLSEDGKGGFIPQTAVNPGMTIYTVVNRYRESDLFADAEDDELQEEYQGKATVRTEAVHGIMGVYDEGEVDYEEADAMLSERVTTVNSLLFGPEILEMNADDGPLHPEALALLFGDVLGPFVQRISKAKPTKTFHEQSQYDETEKAIMDSLQGIGLFKRNKASIKADGAPKQ